MVGEVQPITSLENYERDYSVIIGDHAVDSYENFIRIRPPLNIEVTTHKTKVEIPNYTKLKIFGLSIETQERIQAFDGKNSPRIYIELGYVRSGGASLAFTGTIYKVFVYKHKAERVTELLCRDDYPTANRFIGKTYAPTTTYGDVVRDIAKQISPPNEETSLEWEPNVKMGKITRHKTIIGDVTHHLSNISNNLNTTWSIQDNSINLIPTGYGRGEDPILLSYDTGLVEPPKLNQYGLQVKVNMNPFLNVDSFIYVDSNLIRTNSLPTELTGRFDRDENGASTPVARRLPVFNQISKNGVYYIVSIKHSGTYRSGEWTTTCEAIAQGFNPVYRGVTALGSNPQG